MDELIKQLKSLLAELEEFALVGTNPELNSEEGSLALIRHSDGEKLFILLPSRSSATSSCPHCGKSINISVTK